MAEIMKSPSSTPTSGATPSENEEPPSDITTPFDVTSGTSKRDKPVDNET